MSLERKTIRPLVAFLEKQPLLWRIVRLVTNPLGENSHKKIRSKIVETKKARRPVKLAVDITRRIEVWRNGELIEVDEGILDMVVDAGLNFLCDSTSKGTGRPAVMDYVAIGTDGTAPAAGNTALGAEVMRVQATYTKDAATGEASVDATFNITATYALQECGIFNASTGGTMLCRDTYTTKNVVSGDTVKVYYTEKFQRPA